MPIRIRLPSITAPTGMLLLALSGVGPTDSQAHEEAAAAFRGGDYDTARRGFLAAAEDGSPTAQLVLATMYDRGRGVRQSDTEAARWFRRAAEQGNPFAQNQLGLMYDTGRGVRRDRDQALRWYRRSAEQGNGDAQASIGFIYETGRGVRPDPVEAYKWYALAVSRSSAATTDPRRMAGEGLSRVEARLTGRERERARRLLREWRPAARGGQTR